METLPTVLVSGLVTLVVLGLTFLANRRLGLTEGQTALVSNLKDNVDALEDHVKRLQDERDHCLERLDEVEAHNDRLEQTVYRLRKQVESWDGTSSGKP